ncbi:aminoglycoside phosphotransferase family protein [Streptomyces sp. SID3343]|uniref:aminoglycoside phosphotransferase family protein n=1 Tax=Streptomyces sp. SID3343 TaxID=2690260 RepID=UPI0013713DD2|nr:aminoglycoside phosphotransferase family protein [Streptomyces sp. SID3343]MYV98636.1 phosphotransferase [Streptomyces sp. SID3343]
MSAEHPPAAAIDVDAPLVAELIAAQFPQWADLPLVPVDSGGTDNTIYRLGTELSVRLPRVEWAVLSVEKEQRWLPGLAAHLPLDVPVPVAMGAPAEGYPWPWSVYAWLDGRDATVARPADPRRAAVALAEFVAALQGIDAADGPPPGAHNFFRGEPLARRDRDTRVAIADLADLFDTDALTARWEAALRAPGWTGPPVWIHGDLHAGNLLTVDGRLSAVIDFGGLAVGDPAADVMTAWSVLSADTRELFRAALAIDDATWARARGWALTVAVVALAYYRDAGHAIEHSARRQLDELLAE